MAADTNTDFTIEAWATKMLARALLALLIAAAVAYVLDFAVWRARVAAGGGIGQVSVDLIIAAELKGGKEDYYPQGTVILPCSHSLYPQGGNNPCWWQQRHREKITRY